MWPIEHVVNKLCSVGHIWIIWCKVFIVSKSLYHPTLLAMEIILLLDNYKFKDRYERLSKNRKNPLDSERVNNSIYFSVLLLSIKKQCCEWEFQSTSTQDVEQWL